MIYVIVPNLEYAVEVREGNAKFVKQLETVHIRGDKKIPLIRCSIKYDE